MRPTSTASSTPASPPAVESMRRLEQELVEHVPPGRADGQAHADLARPFRALMICTLAMPMPPMNRLTAASSTVTRPTWALTPSSDRMI